MTTQLERDGAFAVSSYPSAEALSAAIKSKSAYGGLDLSGPTPHLFVASAAGPIAANVMKNSFTQVVQQQVARKVAGLQRKGRRVPLPIVKTLTTPPQITDVVPLPLDDRNGGSIGFLVQALALGATVASTGLGRLIGMTRRSWKRGLGHVLTLIVYAAGSAAVVLWVMSWYGVGTGATPSNLYFEFFLVSLAITASTAGAVALVGSPGALLGLLYFSIGVAISGASIPPEFLPSFWRWVGQGLPTGAGVSAIRDTLYFPAASIGGPLVVLFLYAIVGMVIVLVTNLLPNRFKRARLTSADVSGVMGSPATRSWTAAGRS